MLHPFTKTPFLFIAFLALGILFSAQTQAQKETLKAEKTLSMRLATGISETLNFDFSPGNIALGDPKVLRFQVDRENRKMILVPLTVGKTSLDVYDQAGALKRRYVLTVVISDLAKTARELQDLLGEIEGIRIKIFGRKILIDGEILLPSDLNRIVTVVNQYPKEEVGIIATLSTVAQKIISDKIQEDIHKMGFKEVTVRAVNQRFLVEGEVARGPDADPYRNTVIAIETAKTYVPDVFITTAEKEGIIKRPEGGPPVVVNLLIIKPKPAAEPAKMVRVVTHYVELNKNYAKNFSFNWTPGIRDTSSIELKGGKLSTTVTATLDSLIPKLNNATTHGHARVLESSSLIVQDNEEGTLNNAIQIPITVFQTSAGGTQQATEYVDVGLLMKIKPTALQESSAMRVDVEFQLKTVLGFNERGIPSIGQNKINTVLIVGSGESAAIGGLVTNNLLTNYNKLPEGAASQNFLFNLYRSKSFQNNKSQFVVFITPEIIKSAAEGDEELKRKFRVK